MVRFRDGSVTAQMSNPDMRLPIQYALSFPYRIDSAIERVDFSKVARFDFHSPDTEKFPAIKLAYKAIEMGGNIPCAMNAANEVAVNSFLGQKISFLTIMKVVEGVMASTDYIQSPALEDIYDTDRISRLKANDIIDSLIRK
jgi:1-deoxy-D-xylulose 5-phosphate reductoisomerase